MRAKTQLQQMRLQRCWTQADLIDALLAAADRLSIQGPTPASWKTLISMYENGRRAVRGEHRLLFCEVYQATDVELGFPPADTAVERSATPPAPRLRGKLPAPVNRDMLSYLTAVLDQHAQAEPLVGPRFLVAPVHSQMPLIEQMCRESRGPLRDEVLRVGARYAEFLGWLHQDTGSSEEAMRWTVLAMDLAQELGDPQLIAYILHRRSNIATEIGHAGHGVGLANAALRYARDLSPRVHATVLRQLANSSALVDQHGEASRAIDLARATAAEGDDSDPVAGYCSISYIEMEAANCYVRMGRFEQAVQTYQTSLTQWPAVQERDRGLCLARLASARAILEDIEGAYEAARESLEIAERTGSARIQQELLSLQSRISRWGKLVEIAELNRALDAMQGLDTDRDRPV
jgi:tetratricopeptide (TPR) repeat protein/transcriptional regulator with XRE-family HTH domain